MNNSTPVYSTVTGEAPKSALSKTIEVLDNDPVQLIIKPRTKKHAPPVRKNGKVNHIKVDLRVWKKALQLAGRDLTRIEVIHSTEVIVHNPGWKKS